MNNLTQLFISLDQEMIVSMSIGLKGFKTYPWEYKDGPIKEIWQEITSPKNLADLEQRLNIDLNKKAKMVYQQAILECKRRIYQNNL